MNQPKTLSEFIKKYSQNEEITYNIFRRSPSKLEVSEACLNYDHSYGLMLSHQKIELENRGIDFFYAWRKSDFLHSTVITKAFLASTDCRLIPFEMVVEVVMRVDPNYPYYIESIQKTREFEARFWLEAWMKVEYYRKTETV